MTELCSGRLGWARLTVVAAAVVIAMHGLLHLMGVALLWKLGQPGGLRYADAVPAPGSAAAYVVGGLWLLAAVLFVAAAVLLMARRAAWRITAFAAVVVSVPVIGLMPVRRFGDWLSMGWCWPWSPSAGWAPGRCRHDRRPGPLAAAQPVPVLAARLRWPGVVPAAATAHGAGRLSGVRLLLWRPWVAAWVSFRSDWGGEKP
jgi:hypothetical protein